MTLPRDPDARKYYRVAGQRLLEAELVFRKIGLSAAAIYLTGYSVECILKALILVLTAPRQRANTLQLLREDFGHGLRRLRVAVVQRGPDIPRAVSRELVYLSSWSPELRFEPGPGDPKQAARFLAAARAVFAWADGRI